MRPAVRQKGNMPVSGNVRRQRTNRVEQAGLGRWEISPAMVVTAYIATRSFRIGRKTSATFNSGGSLKGVLLATRKHRPAS